MRQFGNWAEEYAKRYLLSEGLTLIEQNYRSRFGEIDLIMQDARALIFVEVRARATYHYGGGLASVLVSKQKKIMKTAALYIQKIKMHNIAAMRFDVVSIDGPERKLTWIKNAFYE